MPMLVDGDQLVAVDHQRLSHGVEDLAGELVDRVAVFANGLEHHELVAAEAGDEMAAGRICTRWPASISRYRRPGGRACR